MTPAERGKFLRGLVGKPYEPGANGPSAYDCYGLARTVLLEVFGILLPERDDYALQNVRRWHRIASPTDGSLVFMQYGTTRRHVGVWLTDGSGGIIHAVEPFDWVQGNKRPAVTFETYQALKMRHYKRLRFYKHA